MIIFTTVFIFSVKLKMSVYRPNIEAGSQKVPVALSIQKGKLYISCVWKEGQAVLQLEVSCSGGFFEVQPRGRITELEGTLSW